MISTIITWPDWSHKSWVQKVPGKPGPCEYCEIEDRRLFPLVSAIRSNFIFTSTHTHVHMLIVIFMTSKGKMSAMY